MASASVQIVLAPFWPAWPSAFIRRECGLRLPVVVDALDGRRCGETPRITQRAAHDRRGSDIRWRGRLPASWNIELEPQYLRPPGQRVHKLIVNLDTGKWQTTGVLGALGYHVGKNGIDKRTRRAILTEAVEVNLVAASPEFVDYVKGWGAPKSRQRIVKIRDSIRAFAQIRRSTKADYSSALTDWDSDLAWLKAKYQV